MGGAWAVRLTLMQVSPVNCQVVLIVPDAQELPPEWPTGREVVVGNSGAIYVSTICDVDGEVTVEVWQAEELPHPHREPIYDGIVQVRDAGALVGSFTGNHWPSSTSSRRAAITSGSIPMRPLSMPVG